VEEKYVNRQYGYAGCGRRFRRLYQDRENAMVSGVCAGVADFLAVDVTIVRLLVLISLLFFSVLTVAVYMLMAFLLADKPLRYRGRIPETEFWRSADCHGSRRR